MKHFFVYIFLFLTSQSLLSAEYTYGPTQISALKSKLNGNLSSGDIVYLEDGTYNDIQLVFSGNGTQTKPITLKAKNQGKVIFTGKISLKIGGNYLVVDGLVLKDGMAADGTDIVEFRSSSSNFANNCRLTNTVIDNCNNPDESYRSSADKSERWVMFYGKNNRVDHCYFTNKINGGVLIMVVIKETNSQENNHQIDHNFFGSRPSFAPGNNAEIIRLGDSNTSQLSCKSIIENNVFYTCNGEVEIISIKSCDNTVRYNVFYESQGSVVCRHGHRNTIESNAFIGNGVKNCGGIRIINEGHRVYNNFLQDIEGTGSRSALCVMMAIFETPTSSTNIDKEPLNAYHRVKNVQICHNTFVNCKNIDLGTDTKYTYSSTNPYYPNKTVKGTFIPEFLLAQNVFYNTSVNSILNEVNVSKATYTDNIYRFKQNVSITGFVYKALDYSKGISEYGKGIYKLNNSDESVLKPSAGPINFTYVANDISGKTRPSVKSAGAQQFENVALPFITVKPSDCGVDWYDLQKTDIDKITSKTDFGEKDNPNGLTEIDSEVNNIRINNEGSGVYKITSDISLSDVYVFDLNGKLLLSQSVNNNALINCSALLPNIYLFNIRTVNGNTFNQKVTVF